MRSKKNINDTKTLSDVYDSKYNSFTIVSIIMSILIIYTHSYLLFYGRQHAQSDIITSLLFGQNLGQIVVAAFFVISGFMITTSIARSKSLKDYFLKRFKKIYPPLIFCVLVTVFVIAPVISEMDKFEFLASPKLYYRYITDILLFWRNTPYFIADIFAGNPYQSAINGSLWTIKHQISMYFVIVPISMFLLKDNKDKFKYFFILLLTITLVSYTGFYDKIFEAIARRFTWCGILGESKLFLNLLYYFCAGIFLNVYADKIPVSFKNFVFALILVFLTFGTNLCQYAMTILIPYIVIYLGTRKCKYKFIDISYQIYIWAFLIQQLLMYYLNGKISIYLYILLSIVTTVLVSFITYFLTEWLLKKGNLKKLFQFKEKKV